MHKTQGMPRKEVEWEIKLQQKTRNGMGTVYSPELDALHNIYTNPTPTVQLDFQYDSLCCHIFILSSFALAPRHILWFRKATDIFIYTEKEAKYMLTCEKQKL